MRNHGLPLCHHVYAGDTPDVEEFSVAAARMLGMLDQNQIARDTVTLVFAKGSAVLANTAELEQAQVGWIAALALDNQAYNCSPKNPIFVGWQNQYNVIAAVINAASSHGLTITELDFEQELNPGAFAVQARFMYDNAHQETGNPDVLGARSVPSWARRRAA